MESKRAEAIVYFAPGYNIGMQQYAVKCAADHQQHTWECCLPAARCPSQIRLYCCAAELTPRSRRSISAYSCEVCENAVVLPDPHIVVSITWATITFKRTNIADPSSLCSTSSENWQHTRPGPCSAILAAPQSCNGTAATTDDDFAFA